jgi:citrate lyase subunit beta / citryl-CoA lyase
MTDMAQDSLVHRPADRRPAVRSALFTPATRELWIARSPDVGADVVVLDLEDATPASLKESARGVVRKLVPDLANRGQLVWIRINAPSTEDFWVDLDASCMPGVSALCVPKVEVPEDVRIVDRAITYFEGRRGIPFGTIGLVPLVESAGAILSARDIFEASPRVCYGGAIATSKGDVERSIGFRWTSSYRETFVLRSMVLLAARATELANPLTGIVTDLDLDAVRSFAEESRQLGYSGMYVIHPSHVEIANRIFSSDPKEREWAAEVITRYKEAEASGRGAFLDSGGFLVDRAHIRTAHQILDLPFLAPNPDDSSAD